MVGAKDQPVGEPHFIVVIALSFNCLDRAKRRIQDACGYHEDFPTLQDHHNQAKHEKDAAHEKSRVYADFAWEVFYWGDLVTDAVEHRGFCIELVQNLVHKMIF